MIVVDGPTTPAGDRWVAGLNAPDRGVLALVTPPGEVADWRLASAIHVHLGHEPLTPGWRQEVLDEPLLWLEAHRVRHVVLHQAGRLRPALVRAIDVRLARFGATLWCVVDHHEAQRFAQAHAAVDVLAFDVFADRFGAEDVAGDTTRIDPLAPGRPRNVSAPYFMGYATVATWPSHGSATREAVAGAVRALVANFADPRCAAAAFDGAAEALFLLGWRLDRDGQPFAGPGEAERRTFAALRILRDPDVAAMCAMRLLPLAQFEAIGLLVGDVAADGSSLAVRGRRVDVPVEARPYVRAVRLRRLHEGRTADFPLFGQRPARPGREGAADAVAPDPAAFALRTREALATLAEIDLDRTAPRRQGEHERWLSEHGMRLALVQPRRTVRAEPPRGEDLVTRLTDLHRYASRTTPLPCLCEPNVHHAARPSSGALRRHVPTQVHDALRRGQASVAAARFGDGGGHA